MFSSAFSNPNTKSDMYVINNFKKVDKKFETGRTLTETETETEAEFTRDFDCSFVLLHFERSCVKKGDQL